MFPDSMVIILRQGPLHSSGGEHREYSSGVNKDGNIYSQSGEKCLQLDKGGGLGKAGAPAVGIRGTLGKLVRRLRVPEALQFVTISLLIL